MTGGRFRVPEKARCDFCGRVFSPLPRWNCRTCVACAAAGAPDQSRAGYPEKLRSWQSRQGKTA